jgi:hypothetical protein
LPRHVLHDCERPLEHALRNVIHQIQLSCGPVVRYVDGTFYIIAGFNGVIISSPMFVQHASTQILHRLVLVAEIHCASAVFQQVFSTAKAGGVTTIQPSQFLKDGQDMWTRFLPSCRNEMVPRIDRGIKRSASPKGVAGVRSKRRLGADKVLAETGAVPMAEMDAALEAPCIGHSHANVLFQSVLEPGLRFSVLQMPIVVRLGNQRATETRVLEGCPGTSHTEFAHSRLRTILAVTG